MKVNELDLNLYEMANLTSRNTGIENIVIWVGADPERHAARVKVSNVMGKWSNDNFTITLPYLDIVGDINKQLISSKTLSNIKHWIKLNMKTLEEYEKGNIVGTSEFLSKLVKI